MIEAVVFVGAMSPFWILALFIDPPWKGTKR